MNALCSTVLTAACLTFFCSLYIEVLFCFCSSQYLHIWDYKKCSNTSTQFFFFFSLFHVREAIDACYILVYSPLIEKNIYQMCFSYLRFWIFNLSSKNISHGFSCTEKQQIRVKISATSQFLYCMKHVCNKIFEQQICFYIGSYMHAIELNMFSTCLLFIFICILFKLFCKINTKLLIIKILLLWSFQKLLAPHIYASSFFV